MEKIDVKYYNFKYRYWVSCGERWGLLILFFFEMAFASMVIRGDIHWISNIILFLLYIPLALVSIMKSRRYLKSIEIDDYFIYFTIFDYDNEQKRFKIPLSELRVDITNDLFTKWNLFKLEFRRLSLTDKYKFELIHKQYEIGEWKMEKQKEVYKIIRDKQGKFSGTASISRSIF